MKMVEFRTNTDSICCPFPCKRIDETKTLTGSFQWRNGEPCRLQIGRLILISVLLLLLAACSVAPTRSPVPPELVAEVGIFDVPDARFWGDKWPKFSAKILRTYSEEDFKRHFSGVYEQPHNYLAISGGGANGAFGAGLLKGLGAAGARPKYTMVTGVSTGALLAPFAFLGSEFDDQMEAIYTTTATEDIVNKRRLLGVLFSDSFVDTTPLKQLMGKTYTAEMIDAIAREHAKGRRLYVGTTNLDAGRAVIWNIGAIAASDKPDKVDLIHEILRASTAIPVAFPPVVIPVVSPDGRVFDELHVDGGAGSQVFAYPAAIDWSRVTAAFRVEDKPRVFVIRNSLLEPDYQSTKRGKFSIMARTIDSLVRSQGIGDIYQIYALCGRDGNDFNLAYIPAEFTERPDELFDPAYMRKLFDFGFELGRNGYEWKKAPPGLVLAP